MMNLKTIILATVLAVGCLVPVAVASQPVGHIVAGNHAWKMAGSFADSDWKQSKPILQPMAAIGSHIMMDKAVGEASLGEWQIYIGVIRAFIGYWVTPEKEREDYVASSLWSLSPDILQKAFGWNWAHPEIGGDKIFNLNRDQNELLEEYWLSSLIFRVKVVF